MRGGQARPVRVFFYGSFMDAEALARQGLYPETVENGCLKDWTIGFTPYATILPCRGAEVWGVTCLLSPGELEQLFKQPQPGGHRYFPEAVLVEANGGREVPALVHVSHEPVGAAPDPEYLVRLRSAAETRALPESYIRQLCQAALCSN